MSGHAPKPQATFFDHVKELRRRLTWSAVIFMLGGGLGYLYHQPIINFLKRPLYGPLYYDSPAGNFNLIMEVCLLVGLFFALPVLIYNIVRFIEPALAKLLKRRHLSLVTLMGFVLAAMGAVFAYVIVLPMSLHFFQGFKVDGVKALISASSYLNFVIKCLISFMIIFQLPLLILFINFVKPLPPKRLLKYEKYVIVGSLVVAVILPFTYDPITQFVIALPIILLYNMSIVLVWGVNRTPKRHRTHRKTVAKETPPIVFQQHIPKPTALSVNVKPMPKPQPVIISDMVRRPVAQHHARGRVSRPVQPPATRKHYPRKPVQGIISDVFVGRGQRQTNYLAPRPQ